MAWRGPAPGAEAGTFRKGAWLMALAGLALLMSSAWFYRVDTRLQAQGVHARAIVVAFSEGVGYRDPTARQRDADPENRFEFRYPVVRFRTELGQTLTVTVPVHHGVGELGLGDPLEMVYLREDPWQAEILGTRRLAGATLATAILGSACLLPLLLGVALPALWGRRSRAARRRKPQS